MRGRRQLGESLDRGSGAAVLVSRTRQQEHGRGFVDAVPLQHRGAQRAHVWVEDIAVDCVVDHVKLRFRQPEPVDDLVAHHFRVADHRLQPWACEQALLDTNHVAVVR